VTRRARSRARARVHRVELERPGFSLEQGALIWLDERLDGLADHERLELTAGALRLALKRERTVTAAAIAKRRKLDVIEAVDVALEAEPSRRAAQPRGDVSARSSAPSSSSAIVPASALVRRAYDGTTPADRVCGSAVASSIGGRIMCGRCGHELEAHSELSPKWGPEREPTRRTP